MSTHNERPPDALESPGRGGLAVTAARCTDYDPGALAAAVEELLAPLGGMAAFVRPGERIALKPNVLLPSGPERAIVTHPDLVGVVALAVKEAGAHPVVIESPGTGVVPGRAVLERTFRRAGYVEAAERYGFELCLDTESEAVSCPEAVLAKRLEVIRALLGVDGVINLAKLKTHMFMVFTGATKNLFGVIPGLNKAAYHARLNDRRRFADMLLDVAYFVHPRLNIVDGILAMEGNGPGTGGTPRRLGVLVAGADPVAVDAACCRIVGMDTSAVPVLVAAGERGLWSGRETDVETLGTPVAELRVEGFAMPGSYEGIGVGARSGLFNDPLRRVLRRFNRMPRPQKGRCTLCAACERGCPVKAVTIDRGAQVARVEDSLCIHCYCCHEVCPSAAIDLEFRGMARVLNKMRILR